MPGMAWAYLIAAGLCEIGFTTFMKSSNGFTRVWPSIGFMIFAPASFVLLTRAAQTIPLGVAYAVWTGIGAAGTAIVGFAYFKDPFNTLTLLFLVLLVGSIVGLKMVAPV